MSDILSDKFESLRVIELKNEPRGGYCNEFEQESISEWALERLDKDVTVLIYSYFRGSYCGRGIGLCKGKDGRWGYLSMSHCSCNGPTDTSEIYWCDTLEECWNKITDHGEKYENIYSKAKEFIS